MFDFPAEVLSFSGYNFRDVNLSLLSGILVLINFSLRVLFAPLSQVISAHGFPAVHDCGCTNYKVTHRLCLYRLYKLQSDPPALSLTHVES